MFCHRRLVFDELVGKAADRAAKERKRAARAAEAFTQLLLATRAIAPGMPWEEAHVLIASDRDYQAVRARLLLHSPCGIGAGLGNGPARVIEKQSPSTGADCSCQAVTFRHLATCGLQRPMHSERSCVQQPCRPGGALR